MFYIYIFYNIKKIELIIIKNIVYKLYMTSNQLLNMKNNKDKKKQIEKCTNQNISNIITFQPYRLPKYDLFAYFSIGENIICSARNINNGFEVKQLHAEEAVIQKFLHIFGFQNMFEWYRFKVF